MKFILKDDKKVEKEEEVEFWLDIVEGDLWLRCGHPYTSETWNILKVRSSTGRIRRFSCIPGTLGLKLDECSRVMDETEHKEYIS